MAVSLKRYEPQVGVSAQTGTQAITGGLASSMIEAAGAREKTIGSTIRMIGDVSEEIAKKQQEAAERQQALREKALKVERNLLKLELDNKKSVADTLYQSSKEGRTDYNVWGTNEDSELNILKLSYEEIANDPRLQNHPDMQAEYNITLNYGLQENAGVAQLEGVRNLTLQSRTLNIAKYEELIKRGDINGASNLLDDWDELNLFPSSDTAERRVELPRKIEEASIDQLVASDPLGFIQKANEQINGDKTHYNSVDIDYLRAKKSTAQATWNNNASLIEDDLWERYYTAKRNNDISAMETIASEALLADANNLIPAKEAQSLYEAASNPYGEDKESVSIELQSDLYNQASTYNPNQDPDNSLYLEIFNELSHIPNATIRTQLKSVLEDSRNGELQGQAYESIMEVIDEENRYNTLTSMREGLSPERTVFAKHEVVAYLRENPNDYDGALKLYNVIKAPINEAQSKEYFRNQYNYGIPKELDDDQALEDIYLPEKD